jgi:hypothetical protein
VHSGPPSLDPVRLVVGSWSMRATNLPIWLSGFARPPSFTFSLESENPVRLAELLTYSTHSGQEVSATSVSRQVGDRFVARGSGLSRLVRTRWTVAGVSEDEAVVAVRFDKSWFNVDGVNILVRDGDARAELRSEVAGNIATLGLSLEEFASLTWLSAGPTTTVTEDSLPY